MKTASGGFQSNLYSGSLFLPVELYEIVLVDGTTLYWTSNDYQVKFTGAGPRNGRIYSPVKISRTNSQQKRGTQATKFTIKIANDPSLVIGSIGQNLAASVVSRRWIGATITWLRAIGPSIIGGTQQQVGEAIQMGFGRAGQIQPTRVEVSIEVNSPMELLNMDLPWRVLGPDCRWTLYDSNCGISRSSFQVSGTVLAGSTASLILATLNKQTGYFDQGVIIWTSGANNGLQGTVRAHLGNGLASAYPNLVIADKPLAYYRLNADTNDSSGNSHNGTNNGVTFSGSGGPLAGGSGYGIFNGTSAWVDISSVPNPRGIGGNYLGGVSFEFFFNVTAAKQPNGAFGSGAAGQDAGLWNFANSNESNPGFKWGKNHPFADFTAITGAWVHCVAVFRGQRFIDIFLNGLLQATVDDYGTDSFDWTAATLGKAVLPNTYNTPGGPIQWFNGKMAEMAIYAYPMDPGQVFAHYLASTINPVSASSDSLSLVIPALFAPAPGDTFTVAPGCPKSTRACQYIFNNLGRFSGAPFTPPHTQAG